MAEQAAAETRASEELETTKQAVPAQAQVLPALQQPQIPSFGAQQVTTYTPPLFPDAVWTTDLAEKHLTNMRQLTDRQWNWWDDKQKHEHAKSLIGIGIVTVVIVVSLVFTYLRVPGGLELLIAAVSFVGGFLAGDGHGKAQR